MFEEEKRIKVNDVRISCIDILEECYKLYGKSVVLSRAIPNLYDGLKPVQKRIYYTIFKQNYTSKLIKSTAVCADVQKYFHPHGESSVYSALAKLAQKFYTRVSVIDTQGNWGSDEDAPAASRYTECKGNAIIKIFTDDLKSNVVPMIINYAGSDFEPLFLPAKIPMLLINGSYGIAVGYATSILPHNAKEVCNWMKDFILKKGKVKAQDYLKGPDFPLGGKVILDDQWIQACETGKGSVILRARYKLKDITDKLVEINFYELPFRQVRHQIISSLNDAKEKNLLPGVVSFADVSDRKGISLIVHVKKQFVNIALERIFQYSRLECRLHINNVVVMGSKPLLMNYHAIMHYFVLKRREICTEKISFRMEEILERLKRLRVNLVLFIHSEEIVDIIKRSDDPEGQLIQLKFDLLQCWKGKDLPKNIHLLTDIKQFDNHDIHYLLTLTISRLKKRHTEEIINEIEGILKEYLELSNILANPTLLDQYILNDMEEALNSIPESLQSRRTLTQSLVSLLNDKEKESNQNLIILYENSIIGRYLYQSFNDQRRGGKGKKVGDHDQIKILNICECNQYSKLIALTNLGNLRFLDLDKIPYYFESDNLYYLGDQFKLKDNEKVINIIDLNNNSQPLLMMLSSKGKGKLIEFKGISRGRKLMNLKEDEYLVGSCLTNVNEQFVVFTKSKALRGNVNAIRISKSGSGGVRLMRLDSKDKVINLIGCKAGSNFYLIYSNGLIKLNSLESYRLQSRGGTGIRTNAPKSTDLIGVKLFEENRMLTVILSDGRLLKSHLKLSVLGRRAKGVKLIDVEESRVVGVC